MIGIMHPKLRQRFRVRFDHTSEHFRVLEQQAIAFDGGTELLTSPAFEHKTNLSIIWLEDDVANLTMKAIRWWQREQIAVDVWLEVLDGTNTVIERYVYHGCVQHALQHSMWTYSSANDTVELQVKPNSQTVNGNQGPTYSISGDIISPNSRSVVMKLLQVHHTGYSHELL